MGAQAIQEALEAATDSGAETFLRRVRKHAGRTLRRRRRAAKGFEKRLWKRWGQALDLFELILILAQETGSKFNQIYRAGAAEEQDAAFEVLSRLHARSCLTANEVLVLLASGHAPGAEGRWRTAHELAVTSHVIARRDEGIARRYLDHEIIERAADAELYEAYHERLGYEPWEPGVMDALRAERSRLLKRYGKAFRGNYGWAAPLFDGRSPELADLERLVRLDHLQPWRHYGTRRVHASARGASMGVLQRGPHRMLQAGPTNYGLADSGHGVLISLYQATVAFLLFGRSSIDEPSFLVTAKTIGELVNEAGEAFLRAHNELVADEAALWNQRDELTE